ncbi:uncharacterized protein FFFS_08580 [Fusarium fujikuroi]|nr:uncharacterized protein FFC1_13758 [Fusarium fujikuroi]SCV48445.1 uncharacterized protein FFFS_08580 [Fusarium fujikuroi]
MSAGAVFWGNLGPSTG